MDELVGYRLTTTDNPYSPFIQEDEWRTFDTSHGYNTEAYLARVADDIDPDTMSDYQMRVSIAKAMNEILEYDLTGNYKLVTVKDY